MQHETCNLEQCFLCKHCIPEWREIIAVKKQTLAFKKGENIFSEGEKVKGMYFIYSGSAKVHQYWDAQKELIVRFATTGDVLGLRGFSGTAVYPVSATALEDTLACFIDNAFLEASFKTNPSFTYAMMQLYASELHQAEKRMRNLAHMEVKGRIAETLLHLQQLFGMGKDKYIALAITRQDIASYAGTTYETVFKCFTDFTAEKLITTQGKQIRILDTARLKKLVNGPVS